MRILRTTHGEFNEANLLRTVIFTDHPNEFVINEEFRIPACDPKCEICAKPDMPKPDDKGLVLVRRDAHVVLKVPIAAEAAAAFVGA